MCLAAAPSGDSGPHLLVAHCLVYETPLAGFTPQRWCCDRSRQVGMQPVCWHMVCREDCQKYCRQKDLPLVKPPSNHSIAVLADYMHVHPGTAFGIAS